MRKFITIPFALFGAAVFATTTANATGLASLTNAAKRPNVEGTLIKAHSRKQVHDMLHGYGYDRVVYLSRYYGDDYDKPNYKFRACQGNRAFVLDVNWYGHITHQHRAGRCYRDDDYSYRNGRGRRDW